MLAGGRSLVLPDGRAISVSGAQLENGFTRIANELLDRLIAAGLSQNQMRIVLAVIRKTYGYNKKRDDMTISQLATATGIHRTHASRAFHELIAANMLTVEDGRFGYLVGLNKNVAEWRVAESVRTKTATPSTVPKPLQGAYQNRYTDRTKTATDPVPESLHTKDNPQKTTPKDNSKRRDGGKTPLAPTGDVFITLTLNDKTEHPVTEQQAREWSELYPAVDVHQELRKMRGWCQSNPKKRKTKRGICNFITSWLAREQDKGRKPDGQSQPSGKLTRAMAAVGGNH